MVGDRRRSPLFSVEVTLESVMQIVEYISPAYSHTRRHHSLKTYDSLGPGSERTATGPAISSMDLYLKLSAACRSRSRRSLSVTAPRELFCPGTAKWSPVLRDISVPKFYPEDKNFRRPRGRVSALLARTCHSDVVQKYCSDDVVMLVDACPLCKCCLLAGRSLTRWVLI